MHWKQALRYVMRLYRRWKYLRTPRPVFEPTVTPVERHWTATDEKLERGLYVANPNAFWLRPDRHEHKVPCWQIEGVWEEPAIASIAVPDCYFQNSQNPYAHHMGLQNSGQAMRLQAVKNQLANQQAFQNFYAAHAQLDASLAGLSGSLSNLLSPLNQRN